MGVHNTEPYAPSGVAISTLMSVAPAFSIALSLVSLFSLVATVNSRLMRVKKMKIISSGSLSTFFS